METKELTNDLLKGKMSDAMVYRGPAIVTDVNTCIQSGAYRVSPASQNNYFGGWSLLVVIAGGDIIVQEMTALTGGYRKSFRITNTGTFSKIPWVDLKTT